jgi:hypothetical protein
MHSSIATSNRLDDSTIPYRDHKLLTNRQMELMAAARTKGTFAPEALRDIIYRGSEPPVFNHEG